MGIPLLNDILIIFVLSVVVLFVCQRLKVPVIVGFLLTGVIAGPYGLRLVTSIHDVEVLAEVGVILLLFTIGIEFSLEKLLKIKKSVFIGGSVQVGVSIAVFTAIAMMLDMSVENAVFGGFLVSLSSTAIVLKVLQERAEIESPHGRNTLAILIFQDIIVVPMILFTPMLGGVAGNVTHELLLLFVKAIGVVLLVIVLARVVVPKMLFEIARTRSSELFLLSIVTLCLVVAWITSSLGLSLALGAFMAGLVISESEYSNQAFSSILPFKDVFTSFFFVSIGMLLNTAYLVDNIGLVLLIVMGILLGKMLIAGTATYLLGYPLRVAALVGLSLNQVGEFSFILSKFGIEHGLLMESQYQLFLSVSVLTMAATPFIIAAAPRISDIIIRIPLPDQLFGDSKKEFTSDNMKQLSDHLIIVGYGINGKNVSKAASLAGVPYMIIEMNPETVRRERKNGENIYYGDASRDEVLRHAYVEKARIVVVAIADPSATRRITEVSKRLNPAAHIIVRTRFLQDMKELYGLGADEVIPEEFETSIEIFVRVLHGYNIPQDDIFRFVSEVRSDGYGMFRSLMAESGRIPSMDLQLPSVDVSTVRVCEGSSIRGKSIAQVELRKRYGVTVIAIKRDSGMIANPPADEILKLDDLLYIVGGRDKIAGSMSLFSNMTGEDGSCAI